jgi:hypothetical protein
MRSLLAVAVLACAATSAFAAWPDPIQRNLVVAQAAGNQMNSIAVADGAGGMIVAWLDNRAGNPDVYAQRVNANGDMLWRANGVPVVTATGGHTELSMVSDGLGGAILTWTDGRSGYYEIYAQRLAADGTRMWSPDDDGQVVATGGIAPRQTPALIATSDGGTILAWADRRGVDFDIYAQRLSPAGTPLWTVNGVALTSGNGSDQSPQIVTDGAGGAIVLWSKPSSATVMIRRVRSSGTPIWTANGAAVAVGNEPAVVEGNQGRSYVVWQTGVITDLAAQSFDSLGAPQWGPSGTTLSNAAGSQRHVQLARDGAGGFIAVWNSDNPVGIYGGRMGPSGLQFANVHYADTDPTAAGLRLVGDGAAGGWFTWYQVTAASTPENVFAQRIWSGGGPLWNVFAGTQLQGIATDRQNPCVVPDGTGGIFLAFDDREDNPNFDMGAQRIDPQGFLGHPEPTIVSVHDVPGDQGGHVAIEWTPSYLDDDTNNQIETYRVLRRTGPNAYTEVGSTPAWGLPGYGFVATTPADSTSPASPANAFVIRARFSLDTGKTFDSPPDSGWSHDDLAPAMPEAFRGTLAGGTAHLEWNANSEGDLGGYRVYGGAALDFPLDEAHKIADVAGTAYDDPAGAGRAYRLVALDRHGNASTAAALVPAGTTLSTVLALAPPAPNPARAAAAIDFALPHAGRAALEVFDVSGRLARTLVKGETSAGPHAASFNLTDDRGRTLASGLYLVRLTFDDRTLVRRLAVVR